MTDLTWMGGFIFFWVGCMTTSLWLGWVTLQTIWKQEEMRDVQRRLGELEERNED